MASSVGRILRVVAGESHTLVLTDNGKVFAWGKGYFGRLGNGTTSDQWVPAEIQFTAPHTEGALVSDGTQFPHPNITSIAAGAYHSLALTDEGEIWSWGYNIYGQLGHEDFDDAIPHRLCSQDLCGDAKSVLTVVGPEGEHFEGGQEADKLVMRSKVVMVEAGGMMSCAIDQCGVLWMWGYCPFPTNECTEHPFMLSVCRTPQPVSGLQGLHVTKVACGNEHILALADSQYHCEQSAGKHVCYAWGSNTFGQLGLGDRESRVYPQRVQALDEQKVGTLSDVACGAYHSAVLTHYEERGEFASLKRSSACWTFGMGENGQLGQGNTQSLALPHMVESLPENERVVAVACGLFHMGILTEAGGVWIWGMERGLGLCPDIGSPGMGGGDYMLAVRVTESPLFATLHGAALACGAAHTVLAVNDGEHPLWAWGRGQNGVLGTGQCVDCLTPCPVIWPPHNSAETESHAKPGLVENNSSDYPLNHSLLGESATAPLERMLALAQKEICALTTELAVIKKHHAILHAALYGPLESSDVSESREFLREWDRKVVESSYDDLIRLDNFYHQARSRVKEVLLEKRVENYCKQLMRTMKSEVKDSVD